MLSKQRIRIFILLDYYLPGYKVGGPLRTIANVVDRLGNQLEFWIMTRDRDITDTTAYPHIKVNTWNQVGKAQVYYASPGSLSLPNIRRLTKSISPAVIYLNSFFSRLTIKFLLLRWVGLLPKTRVIIAPRGEFSPGALRLKSNKKRSYLALVLKTGLYHNLIWQASSVIEKQHIQHIIGEDCDIRVAADMTPLILFKGGEIIQRPPKIPDKIRMVFISRISPMKNLNQALKILQRCSGQIVFDIYGPIEDEIYWQQCKKTIAHLPKNVQVTYCGSIPHTEIISMLSQYHFFLLPTLGENFGHAILEAMIAGCPVLISNQTPWLDLVAKQAGWDLPLDDLDLWGATLQDCIDMDETTYSALSQSTRHFALRFISSPNIEQDTIDLFTEASYRG